MRLSDAPTQPTLTRPEPARVDLRAVPSTYPPASDEATEEVPSFSELPMPPREERPAFIVEAWTAEPARDRHLLPEVEVHPLDDPNTSEEIAAEVERERDALALYEPPEKPGPPELHPREVDVLAHLRERSDRIDEEETPPPHRPAYATPAAQWARMIELLEELDKSQKALVKQGQESNKASLNASIQASETITEASGAIRQASSVIAHLAEEGCRQGVQRFTGSKKVADALVLIAGGAIFGASAKVVEFAPVYFLDLVMWLTAP